MALPHFVIPFGEKKGGRGETYNHYRGQHLLAVKIFRGEVTPLIS